MERRLLQNLGRTLAIVLIVIGCGRLSKEAPRSETLQPAVYLPIIRNPPPPLVNPSFELGDGGNCEWVDKSGGVHLYCPDEVHPPVGWTASWYNEADGVCDTPTGQPEMLTFDLDPFRIRDGAYSLKYFTFWRCQWVSTWQDASLAPGAYRVSAWVQAWFSGCSSQPYHIGEPLDDQCNPAPWAHLRIRIGVDDVWGEWVEAYNEWAQIEIETEISGTARVTVESKSDAPLKHQDVYIDAVRVERVGE